jgi:trimeric autotransporter adhesin
MFLLLFQTCNRRINQREKKITAMNKNILNLETTVPPLRNLISRSPRRGGLFLISLALICFGLSPAPNAFGVVPAPDGGYPGQNTAEGDFTLQSLTTGVNNTALGFGALFSDTSGGSNSATGTVALFSNTTGNQNTANGAGALFSNTTIGVNSGHDNTASGFAALYSNTTGRFNTASGSQALGSNTTGKSNSANGFQALFHNTMGDSNTANGDGALFSNIDGHDNTAVGFQALLSNSTGFGNTANGYRALFSNTGDNNTAIGINALINSHGSNNIALGRNAGTNLGTGSGNIYIGNPGFDPAESATINIGNSQTRTFIAGISNVDEGGVIKAVYINSNHQLGTQPPASSRRFKKEIKPMDQTSEAILGLKPVTFHYKSDAQDTPQFGLIAEEVAKVNPDLIVRDKNGEVYSVRYDAVNAMLLNEFLKEHRKVEQQEATIAKQQKQIDALTTGLQKVSDQLELNKPALQTVANNQ